VHDTPLFDAFFVLANVVWLIYAQCIAASLLNIKSTNVNNHCTWKFNLSFCWFPYIYVVSCEFGE